MLARIREILDTLPQTPGIYIYRNAKRTIIYVGKSVNLRSRVNSYFREKTELTFAKRIMVDAIADIEWIETRTETEALVLETNLIKEHRPKYNILMKDDKNLAYVKITDDPIPEVVRTRKKTRDGIYFGPYTGGVNTIDLVRSIRRSFHIRACRMKFAEENGKLRVTAKAGRSIPCLDHYIGLCPAPCTLEPDKLQTHKENILRLRNFMTGGSNRTQVLEEITARMRAFAERRQYEEAAKLRDEIKTLDRLSERQIARGAVSEDADGIILLEKYDRMFVGIVEVRWGEIVAVRRFTVENPAAQPAEEVIATILAERYVDYDSGKRLLLLREPLADTSVVELLKSLRINIEYPSLGPKKDLLDFVFANVMNFAYREAMDTLRDATLSRETMASILRTLGYDPPKTGQIIFECNDISHTSGHFTVASRSVITNGKPDSARYRKYKIKSLADGMIDDFASMREVLYRRTLEGIDTGNFPTMILIDGGKGQLSHAIEGIEAALAERGIDQTTIHLPYMASLAKREEEIFTPKKSESTRFELGSAELSLLQKVRDEAHRFAIDFGRSRRDKALKKNILEELPWFGPATRKKLLSAIGSVDKLADTNLEELAKILNRRQLDTLRDHGLLGN